jgi:hypothetical protein
MNNRVVAGLVPATPRIERRAQVIGVAMTCWVGLIFCIDVWRVMRMDSAHDVRVKWSP